MEILCPFLRVFAVHFTCLIPRYFVSERRSQVGENLIFLSDFFCFLEFWVQRFWAFFAVFATVSDTGLGGNTDRHDDVLYLCFIIVIF